MRAGGRTGKVWAGSRAGSPNALARNSPTQSVQWCPCCCRGPHLMGIVLNGAVVVGGQHRHGLQFTRGFGCGGADKGNGISGRKRRQPCAGQRPWVRRRGLGAHTRLVLRPVGPAPCLRAQGQALQAVADGVGRVEPAALRGVQARRLPAVQLAHPAAKGQRVLGARTEATRPERVPAARADGNAMRRRHCICRLWVQCGQGLPWRVVPQLRCRGRGQGRRSCGRPQLAHVACSATSACTQLCLGPRRTAAWEGQRRQAQLAAERGYQ